MKIHRELCPVLASLLVACASTSAQTHSDDLSAAQQSSIASADQTAAVHEAEQYHASAAQVREHCVAGTPDGTDVCWTSIINPTADHLRNARRLYSIAEQHRAASQALRDAEARACRGISAPDRDTSPFIHRDDIQSVDPLSAPSSTSVPEYIGATVVFTGVRGLTPEVLQRLLVCHMARSAVEGHDEPDMTFCPVALAHVEVATRAVHTGVAVDIRSSDPATAAEVLRRARALVAPPPPAGTR